MSGWGIAETAPVIEKIKAESADYLRGLNSCGDITWSVYDKAFDFYMELISRAYKQGKKDAEPQWIPCSEGLPGEYMSFYATVKSLVDNRERWVIEGMYTKIEQWGKIPMIDRGEAEVIAWMPKDLPVPWRGDAE